MFDLVIKNGTVIDGSGSDAFSADIAIKDGKIAKIATDISDAKNVIDASGLTVTPGFIDSHSHSDNALLAFPALKEKCEQGITTAIAGQCGSSAMPNLRAENPLQHNSKDFFDAVSAMKFGSNTAIFAGHSTIRKSVMGMANRECTSEELDKMCELLGQAIDAGAMGVSFGLIYTPSCYAKTDELIALAKVAAKRGGMVAAHIRNESDLLIEAVAEFIEIIKESGARGVISHHKAAYKQNHGKVKETIKMIEEANRSGMDIYCDVYPYVASSTSLSARFVPKEFRADGKTVENLRNPETREKIKQINIDGGFTKLDWILITKPPYAGKFISEIAKEQGKTDLDTALDIIKELNDSVSACYFSMCEDDIETVLKFPRAMICTDSSVAKDLTAYHPRLRGSFPRAIRRFVRELGTLPLTEMIRRMTSLPASVYSLSGKGLIKEGYDADICIFDAEKITDKAEFLDCGLRAEGLSYVLVNGEVVAKEATYTGALPGSVILRKN